jgi:1,4-alpha-glucan branching enzyme
MLYRLRLHWDGGIGDRIPPTRRRGSGLGTPDIQRPGLAPARPLPLASPASIRSAAPPLIYEAHVGMAQETAASAHLPEFTGHVLPRIVACRLQHAPAHGDSRSIRTTALSATRSPAFSPPHPDFGTPDGLKALVDTAHGMGLRVAHGPGSLAMPWPTRWKGSGASTAPHYQYFHTGERGRHPAWGIPGASTTAGRRCCISALQLPLLAGRIQRGWVSASMASPACSTATTAWAKHSPGMTIISGTTADEEALAYLALANRLMHELAPGQ